MKRIIYIFSLLALLSCDKEGQSVHREDYMDFSVTAPGVVSTKGEVTEDVLKRVNDIRTFVYAATSDGTTSSPVVDAPGSPLVFDAGRAVWNPYTNYYLSNGVLEGDKLIWEDGKYYRFYGFAYSANAVIGTDLKIDNYTYGRQFTVTQPENGDGTSTIDYLLSSLVNVNPSANRPLVPVHLEHAMARVDVDVQIAQAMFNGNQSLVKDISVKIVGIRRKATMLCQQPKLYGEDGTNTWYITFDESIGAAAYSYSMPDDQAQDNLEGSDANNNPDMSFMAIPVKNDEMDGYVLTLEYNSNPKTGSTGSKDFIYTFDLKAFSPKGWLSGHKIKYVLTIDNSIHLKASVVDYEDVEYFEAVILPDIKPDNDVNN